MPGKKSARLSRACHPFRGSSTSSTHHSFAQTTKEAGKCLQNSRPTVQARRAGRPGTHPRLQRGRPKHLRLGSRAASKPTASPQNAPSTAGTLTKASPTPDSTCEHAVPFVAERTSAAESRMLTSMPPTPEPTRKQATPSPWNAPLLRRCCPGLRAAEADVQARRLHRRRTRLHDRDRWPKPPRLQRRRASTPALSPQDALSAQSS